MVMYDKGRDAFESGQCPAGHATDTKTGTASSTFHAALFAPFVCGDLARGRSQSCIRAGAAGSCDDRITVSTYGRWLKKKAPGALDRLDCVPSLESGSKVVAAAVFQKETAPAPLEQGPYIQALRLEPASGIEPPTCGLRI